MTRHPIVHLSTLALIAALGTAFAASAQDSAAEADAGVEAATSGVEATEPPQPDADTAAIEAPAEAAPTLADIAESSPDLEMRDGEGDEPDTMVMLSDVLFPFGEFTLRPEAIETLRSVAPQLAELGPITIQGHTDSIGDADYNVLLGEARAAAVRDWLVGEGGLAADQFTVVGIGEADPVAAEAAEDGTDLPENRALNRRVEFVEG